MKILSLKNLLKSEYASETEHQEAMRLLVRKYWHRRIMKAWKNQENNKTKRAT